MKNTNNQQGIRQERRLALLASLNIRRLIVIMGAPTVWQRMNNGKYITLLELSRLHLYMPQERHNELDALLPQIAANFQGWKEFFQAHRINKDLRPLAIRGLNFYAQQFSQKQELLSILEGQPKKNLIEKMKLEAESFNELMDILHQEFDVNIYRKALYIARGDKDKLLAMINLNISNQRRAYLYRCLLSIKDSLTTSELLLMYRHIKKTSVIAPRLLRLMSKRNESFHFWFTVYKSEYYDSPLKHFSFNRLEKSDINLEDLVNTCNSYSDPALQKLTARKLRRAELDAQKCEKIYELTSTLIPNVRMVILNKQRQATITADQSNNKKFYSLRSLYIKSNRRFPANKTFLDMINLLPSEKTAPAESCHNTERSAQIKAIVNILITNKDRRLLKQALSDLASKINGHDEWMQLYFRCKPNHGLQKLIMDEYERLFLTPSRLSQSLPEPSPSTRQETPNDLKLTG